MLFSSLTFLFAFLPVTLALYFILPRVLRNTLLLVVSLIFYAWGEGAYIVVMGASILINWALALAVHSARAPAQARAQRLLMIVAVTANLMILGVFKYADFIVGAVNDALQAAGVAAVVPLPNVHLPIGVSFFTFHALSYVIDVYRGIERPERSPLRVALYISLFPQLVAGPIIRYSDVASQLESRTITLEGFAYGIHRFVIGLAKKVLLANTFAIAADHAFSAAPGSLSAAHAWIGLAAYTLQLYFDFSGYSDMAIGLGRMFGFTFLENFNYPYISASVTEFWRRWHISLSSWFRDYLYKPLGGNRRGATRTYLNLTLVFLLCGLWHGASWNFVIWGALHGAYLVTERIYLKRVLDELKGPLRVLAHAYTVVCVMLAWVFFRADTLPQAIAYLSALFGASSGAGKAPLLWNLKLQVAFAVGVAACMPVGQWLVKKQPRLRPTLHLLNTAALFALFMLAAMSLASGTHNPFIYFRF